MVAAHGGAEGGFSAVGHRIVHGGQTYLEPVRIDDRVLAGLQELIPLAPLHQPSQIEAIRAMRRAAPGTPQVACFDTAFHCTQSPLAREFALPREFGARGIRRYGFHGLSYEYIVSSLPRVAPECAQARIVVAHLGNGQACARSTRDAASPRRWVDSPGWRADGHPVRQPGSRRRAVSAAARAHGAAEIEHLLYERSGLLGVSGVSSDMRTLLGSATPSAKEAVDLFVYWVGRELGSLAATMGGLDALIFTGGIGEHAHQIRSMVCRGAKWLGVVLDEAANLRGGPRITSANSATSAWVIPTTKTWSWLGTHAACSAQETSPGD